MRCQWFCQMHTSKIIATRSSHGQMLSMSENILKLACWWLLYFFVLIILGGKMTSLCFNMDVDVFNETSWESVCCIAM